MAQRAVPIHKNHPSPSHPASRRSLFREPPVDHDRGHSALDPWNVRQTQQLAPQHIHGFHREHLLVHRAPAIGIMESVSELPARRGQADAYRTDGFFNGTARRAGDPASYTSRYKARKDSGNGRSMHASCEYHQVHELKTAHRNSMGRCALVCQTDGAET